jgi:hypothetical protein
MNCIPIWNSKKIRRGPLLLVRRTYILVRCGKPLAADALLGRFLPRLGPPVATQAASFFGILICLLVAGACRQWPAWLAGQEI